MTLEQRISALASAIGADVKVLFGASAASLPLRQSDLLSSTTIRAGSLRVTPGAAYVPSGISITVEPLAEWVLLEDEKAVLQYDGYFGRWDSVRGVNRELVGRTDEQTLERKTLIDPKIEGAIFTNAVAVTHSHTLSGESTIPSWQNALSAAPVTILSGGSVKVSADSVWKFL